jgi:pimeloyl-ACP methyl ester carboxylesterase
MEFINRMKNFLLKNVERPMIKFFLFSIFDTLVGATGMLLYGIFTHTYGPIWVRNQYIGLWLTALIMFISIQSLYIEVKSWNKYSSFLLDLMFFSVELIINLLMLVFYSMAKKIDASIWSVYLFSVNLTNLFILFSRRRSVKEKRDSTNNQSAEDTLISHPLTQNQEVKSKSIKENLFFALKIFNGILRIACLIVSGFLVAGACIDGTGRPSIRGKFINVRIGDTESTDLIKLHYLCSKSSFDTNDDSVIMLEGDLTHSLVDLLSLQKLLALKNRTSCIWDKPGLGFSDYLYNGMKSYNLYHNMINAMLANEEMLNLEKLSFVATGSFGGDLIYQYALDHPERVKSLTFLDVVPNNVEFSIKNKLSNFTEKEAEAYKNKEYSHRQTYSKLKNAFGVPWGIISFYIEPYKAFFSYLNDDIDWFSHTEKKSITENYFINIIKDKVSSFSSNVVINDTIPLYLIISKKSDEQIIQNKCTSRKIDRNSNECKFEINSNRMLIQEKEKLSSLVPKSKLIECNLDECSLDYFLGAGANYTVSILLIEFNL